MLAFIILFVVVGNCFSRFSVKGVSMQPAYQDGQKIWGNRWASPTYDCVVALDNPDGSKELILKRVVGLPGDTFVFIGNDLYREIAPENLKHGVLSGVIQSNLKSGSILIYITKNPDLDEKEGGLIVEDRYIFVLGDNQDNSTDSRYFGMVPLKSVRGVMYGGKKSSPYKG
jgi:signal peptidase I